MFCKCIVRVQVPLSPCFLILMPMINILLKNRCEIKYSKVTGRISVLKNSLRFIATKKDSPSKLSYNSNFKFEIYDGLINILENPNLNAVQKQKAIEEKYSYNKQQFLLATVKNKKKNKQLILSSACLKKKFKSLKIFFFESQKHVVLIY